MARVASRERGWGWRRKPSTRAAPSCAFLSSASPHVLGWGRARASLAVAAGGDAASRASLRGRSGRPGGAQISSSGPARCSSPRDPAQFCGRAVGGWERSARWAAGASVSLRPCHRVHVCLRGVLGSAASLPVGVCALGLAQPGSRASRPPTLQVFGQKQGRDHLGWVGWRVAAVAGGPVLRAPGRC